MSVPVIKAICRRIEARMGSGKNAALAAGVSAPVWSTYCSEEHPTITIPIGRLLDIASGDERAAVASLFTCDDQDAPACLRTEAEEATEAAAELQRAIREAKASGKPISELDRRRITKLALSARAEIEDVLQGIGDAA